MYLVKTPKILKRTYPKYVWDFPTVDRSIYLTFDDGPTPNVTNWVLDELEKYQAKATFFCLGKNVIQNNELFKRIAADGHAIGNHTYSHLNGWKNKQINYLKDVVKCQQLINTQLFRPPYGKLTKMQARTIGKKFNIIMWDVLSADFDTSITPETCTKNVLLNTKKGSIIVFHDSLKAAKNLKHTLPIILNHFSELDYQFKAIG